MNNILENALKYYNLKNKDENDEISFIYNDDIHIIYK
jgi:hypothetical protein